MYRYIEGLTQYLYISICISMYRVNLDLWSSLFCIQQGLTRTPEIKVYPIDRYTYRYV